MNRRHLRTHRLQDLMMIFHDSADCPGIITSDETGRLTCAECGQNVEKDPGVLAEIEIMPDPTREQG